MHLNNPQNRVLEKYDANTALTKEMEGRDAQTLHCGPSSWKVHPVPLGVLGLSEDPRQQPLTPSRDNQNVSGRCEWPLVQRGAKASQADNL